MDIRELTPADARALRSGVRAHVDDEHPLALHLGAFRDGSLVGIVSGVPVGPEGQTDGSWLEVVGASGEIAALLARLARREARLWAAEAVPGLTKVGHRWEWVRPYDVSDIVIIEGVEAVRKRPGMYVGSTGAGGVTHLLWELVSNTVDEHLAGFATRMDVQLGPIGLSVVDDGRGIPPEALEIVFTTLCAGSHRGEPRKHVHAGLHGLGLSVVNALSSVLVATVDRERRTQQTFVRGRPVSEPVEVGAARGRGTGIWFVPDVGIFTTDQVDRDVIVARLAELAVLNPGLAVHVDGAAVPSYGGLRGYAEHLAGPGLRRSWSNRLVRDGVEVEVAVAWGDGEAVTRGWANQFRCHGTHLAGLNAGLKGADPRGRVALVSVQLDHLEYRGRTREELYVPEVRDVVAAAAREVNQ